MWGGLWFLGENPRLFWKGKLNQRLMGVGSGVLAAALAGLRLGRSGSLPVLRTGALVRVAIGAQPELARWFVPRTWTPLFCQALTSCWTVGRDCTRTSGLDCRVSGGP